MPSPTLEERLAHELEAWAAAGLHRELCELRGLDFCTNDYLGLARDARLIEAACAATRSEGAGAAAARLLGGESPQHQAAEEEAAAWLGSEAALLFPSGWHANLALLQTLPQAGDLILSDALNHASLIDGMRLSQADVEVFTHNNVASLAAGLKAGAHYARRWIVCESVYSTNGSLAPLADYAALAAEHDAWLLVDEAHAAGLYGARGEGRAVGSDLEGRVVARTVTGGKALGVIGAFVACSRRVRELLLQRGRSFVFTTATPPGPVAALRTAMQIVQSEPDLRAAPHRTASLLRGRLQARQIAAPGESPIVPIPVGTPERAVAVATRMQAAGYEARAVRPPPVPAGESCLRVVCHAGHTDEQVEQLVACLEKALAAEPEARPVPTANLPTLLVVVGTDTDVGKTVVAALLARAARHAETSARPLRYTKPLQTGSDSDTQTVAALAGLDAERCPAPLLSFPLPASVDQAAQDVGARVEVSNVVGLLRARLAEAPQARWILETAGGLLVPLNEREDQADVLVELGAPVVLVARSGLGTLNHTRLTLEALRKRRLVVRALFLVGPPHAANVETLRRRLPHLPLFEVPPFSVLDSAALDAWLAHNDVSGLLP
jgi:8-amino-7-oxononanoate synthase